MAWETHPVTPDRFEGFADVVNPNRRSTHCWCLSHRLRPTEIESLGGDSADVRERAARALCAREDIPRPVHSTRIAALDEVPVWSVVRVVVRGGWRKQGVTSQVIEGAVAFVGTRAMIEKVGFEVVGTTHAVASTRPRLRMRRVLA